MLQHAVKRINELDRYSISESFDVGNFISVERQHYHSPTFQPLICTQFEKLKIGVLKISRSDNIVLLKNNSDVFCIRNILETLEKEVILIGHPRRKFLAVLLPYYCRNTAVLLP